MQIKGRGPGKRSDSTKLLNGCAGHLFGDKITVWRIKRTSELCTRRLLDPRRKLRLAIHLAVEVVGVQHQESCGHHGRYSRRTPRAAQRRNLAEKMAGTQPEMLVPQFYFHFAVGDQIHCMGGFSA